MYQLTSEGKKYLKEGLPEQRLVDLVTSPMSMETARQRMEDFNIGLIWAKNNGWIKIEKGNLVPVKSYSEMDYEKGLKIISEGKKPSDEIISLLLKRKLVFEEKETAERRARQFVGKEVTQLTPELIKTGLWKDVKLKPYNVTATGKTIHPGKFQPYNVFINEFKEKLLELGFKEMEGPTIESEFWNFDALFQAQNHPSRDWTQTYSIKGTKRGKLPDVKIVSNVKAAHENGWKTGSSGWGYKWNPEKAAQLMPRAHGTACSARQLGSGIEIPGKYFAIRRCYRPDVIDATHGVEFNQMDGIIIDESMTFRNMLGVLRDLVIEMAGAEDVRFYPDYYPFTEPSVQISAKHPDLGWVELAGAGIFRPELTEPLGVKTPVLAWGFGIDRLAMYKLGIKDIRYLFSDDLKWLREQRVV